MHAGFALYGETSSSRCQCYLFVYNLNLKGLVNLQTTSCVCALFGVSSLIETEDASICETESFCWSILACTNHWCLFPVPHSPVPPRQFLSLLSVSPRHASLQPQLLVLKTTAGTFQTKRQKPLKYHLPFKNIFVVSTAFCSLYFLGRTCSFLRPFFSLSVVVTPMGFGSEWYLEQG